MKIRFILITTLAVLLLSGLILYPRFHRWARAHVNSKTAVEDHPLLCTSCHLYIQKSGFLADMVNAQYYSPFELAVSKDGKKLYVVAEEGNSLLIIDTDKNKVVHKIRVGDHPHSVVLTNDGNKAYVSNQWSDNISVVDLTNLKITDTLNTGGGPAGLALSSDGQSLYAANSYSSDISVINIPTGTEVKRFRAGNNPTGVQASADGKLIYFTSRRNQSLPYGDTIRSEITVLNDRKQRIVDRKQIKSAYVIENIAFTPSRDLAIFTLVRPKNNIPTLQVDRGWMMTYGIGIMELKPNGRTVQFLIDEPNEYFADPFDIVITPDSKRAFVSSAGVDFISAIDIDSIRSLLSGSSDELLNAYGNYLGLSSRFVVKRIPTGSNPKGLALSPDGERLYVAEHLQDRIMVINTKSLETEKTIDLGGPRRLTVARQGRRLLNNAGHTFQTQYSCYTCHPDAHEDGLVYNMASKDMGRNVTNTQSLRDIGDTPPFKWNGKNQTVYKQDGMRFSTVLTRTEPFSYKELDALVAYIITGIPYPPNIQHNPTGVLNELQLRGKAIYERTHDKTGKEIPVANRCITCHPAPYFTNLKMVDVQTLAATDDSMLFDTPHLNNIYASAPYLHDGRAATLEEIWTKYNPNDKHGVANDLTKIELNELVEYLKTLSSPDYYRSIQKKNQQKR